MKIIAVLVCILFNISGYAQSTKSELQGKAIICLTYDDAIESQLYNAIPQLDSLGLKATFFLTSLKGSTETFGIGEPSILEWKKAAQNGHELGNHTLFHACPEAIGWQKELAIESYTVDQLLGEIAVANQFLNLLEGKNKVRSYAFPCNNTIVEGRDYSSHLKKRKLVSHARWGGFDRTIIYDFKILDPMKVPSWLVNNGTTLDELINFAKSVKMNGKMGVYQFHGIGSPLFNVSPTVHRQFLEYLKLNENDYWVTTFSSAMEYVMNEKEGKR